MDKTTFRELNRGDIVQHVSRDFSARFIVIDNLGNRVTAIAAQDLINPDEWDLVLKASYNKPRL